MSIKKIVLVLGLLVGVSSSLNAVKPEHQARVDEIEHEVSLQHLKMQDTLPNIRFMSKENARAVLLGIIDRMICLFKELSLYAEEYENSSLEFQIKGLQELRANLLNL
jgi:hypothetical protein